MQVAQEERVILHKNRMANLQAWPVTDDKNGAITAYCHVSNIIILLSVKYIQPCISRLYSDYLYMDFLYRRKHGTDRTKRNSMTFHQDVLDSMTTFTSCIKAGNSLRACSYDYADVTPAVSLFRCLFIC